MARLLAAGAAVAAIVLLLAYAGGLFVPPVPEPAASKWTSAIQTYTLYHYDSIEATKLVPIDPQTLDDRPDGAKLEPGGIISTDGSTRVDAEYPEGRNVNSPGLNPEDIWIVVRDLQSGAERSRFHPPVQGLASALSADGTRLALQPFPHTRYPPMAEWYVVDTADGQLLAHVQDADVSCFRQMAHYDLAGHRIFCVVDPAITEADEPEPMQVVAYDIESSSKAGELELPKVLIGGSEIELNGQVVDEFFEPAVELSPDGQRLAIVHADADKVTLLDARRLSIERTFSLERSFSLESSASLLELFAPSVAYAKGEMTGTISHAKFSLDGRYLYLFAQEVRMVPGQKPPEKRGLWLVDLEQDAITAETLAEYQIQWIEPAPDGTVYVFGTSDERLGPHEIRASSPSMLWRLDAQSLEILAAREFTGYRAGQLVPVQPAG
jgi:hypothetical protein